MIVIFAHTVKALGLAVATPMMDESLVHNATKAPWQA